MNQRDKAAIIGLSAAIAGVLLLRKAAAAQVTLRDLVISPTAVHPGEEVTISVTAINVSDETLTTTVTLGGDFMAQQTITLAPGESMVVSFTISTEVPKTYTVKVDGLTGTFICTEEPIADIRLSNLVITPSECYVGETVTISVTATNYGTAPGTKIITCTVT